MALGPEDSRFKTRLHKNSAIYGACCTLNHQMPSSWCRVEVWRRSRVPAQAYSSSSDRGSELQGASQNSPLVISKRDVNVTKLISIPSALANKLPESAASHHYGLLRSTQQRIRCN
ncbi:hypothetical protein AVEN_178811-1 [Araneus ventricosus]|uniref:Uncharacterized protein n=1 Tax=Araneus ventricosus TaxID=182803 RepID=A0A4Y2BG48_ARAVE|nr:hypothetical protein AVEN_178811-1 [Araneus ventricosus]